MRVSTQSNKQRGSKGGKLLSFLASCSSIFCDCIHFYGWTKECIWRENHKPITWRMSCMAVWNTALSKWRTVIVLPWLFSIQIRANHVILNWLVTFTNSTGTQKPFLSNVMECSNIRLGFGYSYYSNENYRLIAYGASDRHCNMDPYGRHSRNNDNKTKFRVISECICFWMGSSLWIWLCVTQSSQSVMAGSKSKDDWLRLIKATKQWQVWVTEGSSAIQ